MARTYPIGPSGIDPNPTIGRLSYVTITVPTFSGPSDGHIDTPKISNNTGVYQGQMVGFKVKANNPSNGNITFSLRIKDRDGDIIYTDAGLVVNSAGGWTTTVVMGLNVPLVEQEIISILPSTDPGATSLIVRATLYWNPDNDVSMYR